MTDAFSELVMPIFRKGIELQDRLSREESLTLAQVQQMARGWIEEARRRAAGNPGLGRSFELSLFGLVAWIDESLYQSEWGRRLSPEENILEWDLFGTRLRAGRYYREARKAERNRDPDAMEVYLLALTLGFRGLPPVDFDGRDQLRDDADEVRYRGAAEVDYDVRLAGWVDGLYQIVSGAGGVPDRPFAEDPPHHDRFAPLHGPTLLLAVSILVSITALVTLAAYLLAVRVDYDANHPGSLGRPGGPSSGGPREDPDRLRIDPHQAAPGRPGKERTFVTGFWQNISQAFSGGAASHATMIVGAVIAAVLAGFAWFWSRHPVRWILVLLTVGVILLVAVYRSRMPGPDDLDPDLPGLFFPPFFSWWVLVLALAAVYLSTHLVWVWGGARRGGGAGDPAEPSEFPDLEAAWDEIQVRLSHARYDAGQQKVFLLLGTEESIAAAMIRGAGQQFFAQAPGDEDAPIHAYATADALFVSCAGACSWGRGEAEGAARLVWLCRRILALNPEQPVLRGVAVLYPMEKVASPEMLQRVVALRNDLQTIRAELKVRCPTLAVFCLREPYAGFDEFVARIPPNVRVRRCGFSVPQAQPFDREAALRGLGWLAQWFSTWSMKLMTDDYHNTEGNNKLVTLNAQLRRGLPAMAHLLEVSFSTHARAEPVLVRGCYFVSCGPDPENQAFAPGLVGGKASKMIADAACTTWSEGAGAVDRRYRLAAIALGAATAVVALPIWFTQIIKPLGTLNALNAFRPGLWLAWGCLGALVLAWTAGLLSRWLGRKEPAKAASGA